MSFVASVVVLTVVYVVVGRLERTPALRFRELPSPRPYLATDVAWYGVAIVATAISVFVFRPVLANLDRHAAVRDALAGAPFPLKLLLGVVVFDLVSFLVHRGLHRYDVLWNIHKVHHSSLQLDGFATTRTHMVENLLRFVPGQALLFLVGMPVTVVDRDRRHRRRLRRVQPQQPRHRPALDRAASSSRPGCIAATTSRRPPRTTTAASSPSGTASPARSSGRTRPR